MIHRALKILAQAAIFAALAFAPASAGIAFEQIPANGKALYGQLPDGSYAILTLDNAGHIISTSAATGAPLTPLGYGKITATASAVGLSSVPSIGIPAGATLVIVEPEGADARYRDDGTNPTASSGMRLGDGARLAYSGDLTQIKFIAQTGTAAFNVIFYK